MLALALCRRPPALHRHISPASFSEGMCDSPCHGPWLPGSSHHSFLEALRRPELGRGRYHKAVKQCYCDLQGCHSEARPDNQTGKCHLYNAIKQCILLGLELIALGEVEYPRSTWLSLWFNAEEGLSVPCCKSWKSLAQLSPIVSHKQSVVVQPVTCVWAIINLPNTIKQSPCSWPPRSLPVGLSCLWWE